MCIIIYKPKGQLLPGKDIIKTCLENNPDGAGYMFNTGQDVYIQKGFNDYKRLLKSLRQALLSYRQDEKDVAIVIHARIATAGKVKPENCHPFPISASIGDLQNLRIICKRGFAHNGIIDIEDENFKNLSDTQIFIKNVLSKININDAGVIPLLNVALSNSRTIIFDKTGMVYTSGKWVHDKEIYYSNDTYKENFPMWKYRYWNKDTFLDDSLNTAFCDLCGSEVFADEIRDKEEMAVCKNCIKQYNIDEGYN